MKVSLCASLIHTTRYTHRKRGLDVSKFGLPVSHSGQNVIHLGKHSRYQATHRKNMAENTHPPYNSAVLNTTIQ